MTPRARAGSLACGPNCGAGSPYCPNPAPTPRHVLLRTTATLGRCVSHSRSRREPEVSTIQAGPSGTWRQRSPTRVPRWTGNIAPPRLAATNLRPRRYGGGPARPCEERRPVPVRSAPAQPNIARIPRDCCACAPLLSPSGAGRTRTTDQRDYECGTASVAGFGCLEFSALFRQSGTLVLRLSPGVLLPQRCPSDHHDGDPKAAQPQSVRPAQG